MAATAGLADGVEDRAGVDGGEECLPAGGAFIRFVREAAPLLAARAGRVGRMIVAFSISPAAGDDTGGVSEAVAEAIRVVRASGLPNETNAMFTNIEGEWDEVMAVVKQAVEAVAAVSPRVSLVLKADIRPGYTGQLTAKVERIEQALSD
jgi:uncharacterized protein (TIGR00106 family)